MNRSVPLFKVGGQVNGDPSYVQNLDSKVSLHVSDVAFEEGDRAFYLLWEVGTSYS